MDPDGIAPFSAALIGWVEANRDDDLERNRLCPPNGFAPEADARNFARRWAVTQRAVAGLDGRARSQRVAGHMPAQPLGNAGEYLAEPAMEPSCECSSTRARRSRTSSASLGEVVAGDEYAARNRVDGERLAVDDVGGRAGDADDRGDAVLVATRAA